MDNPFISNKPRYSRDEERNTIDIALNKHCNKLISEIEDIRDFFEDYSFHERPIVSYTAGKTMPFNLGRDRILFSIEQTLGSFQSVCGLGNFSDAHILMRKLRDDLFFYLFTTVTSIGGKPIKVKEIELWMSNALSNLHFSDVLKRIANSPSLIEPIKHYKLQETFADIGAKLNNFTHGNGIDFYNMRYSHYQSPGDDKLQNICEFLGHALNHVVVTFIFLETLCNPLSIASSDYVDHLDMGMTPPDNSQYWVAPYIKDFFERKKGFLDDNCITYLRENMIYDMEL
jgi:hypothetical protein